MPISVWATFFAIYAVLLVLDLGVLHRESEVMSVSRALLATLMWIVVALLFSGFVYCLYEFHWLGVESSIDGVNAFLQFITGYVLEWSLSVDNIFVIAIILSYMQIPVQYQYRVLFWGIVGAIALRGALIIAGSALIHNFDWMFYVFGAILIWSAISMFRTEEEFDPEQSKMMRLIRRLLPVTDTLSGDRFIVTVNRQRMATPLLVALLFVDIADVVFAVDSIPAIFAVTQDTFLVFTSNAFAILGLRALYFAVAGLLSLFKYLKTSLVIVLGFIGAKMLLHAHFKIPDGLSLAVILGVLTAGVLVSLWSDKRKGSAGK
ncbi:MAG TPA: TerC/Alx family metal homeostasis membrane protein [Steroidobacteraceae bacterium]|nr:TerC/Alx family metal homeostasis membrane protein [Steroidobacteraceae bacterium]